MESFEKYVRLYLFPQQMRSVSCSDNDFTKRTNQIYSQNFGKL